MDISPCMIFILPPASWAAHSGMGVGGKTVICQTVILKNDLQLDLNMQTGYRFPHMKHILYLACVNGQADRLTIVSSSLAGWPGSISGPTASS